jgi:hypothetical protein
MRGGLILGVAGVAFMRWPYLRGGLILGVAFMRGSTVLLVYKPGCINFCIQDISLIRTGSTSFVNLCFCAVVDGGVFEVS